MESSMDLVSGLAAFEAAMTCLKGVKGALKLIKETDQKLDLQDIRSQLADLQDRLLDAKDQTAKLIYENQGLHQQLAWKNEVQHQEDGNICWRVENCQKKGPYCSTCYGDVDKLIPLSGNDDGKWFCSKCKNHFHTRKWNENQKQRY
jgi:hypothetical protein